MRSWETTRDPPYLGDQGRLKFRARHDSASIGFREDNV